MEYPAFWIALVCQLIIVWGYFWFYRKEQLGQSYIMGNQVMLKLTSMQYSTPIMDFFFLGYYYKRSKT
jgi:hypothetical protein